MTVFRKPRIAATPLRFAITSPHLDVKRTYTSKLSFMHGVQQLASPVQPGGTAGYIRRLMAGGRGKAVDYLKSGSKRLFEGFLYSGIKS